MLTPPFSAVILAGGAAKRLGGGDKPLRMIGGKPILDWIIERIKPQIHALALSANGNPARFAAYSRDILPDFEPHLGPMAGIVSAMEWAKKTNPIASHVLILSGDSPFIPSDLVRRLAELPSIAPDSMIAASSAGRTHPTIGFWPIAASDRIKQAIIEGKGRRVSDWLEVFPHQSVEWETQPFDPFFNINTQEDLAAAELVLGQVPVVAG